VRAKPLKIVHKKKKSIAVDVPQDPVSSPAGTGVAAGVGVAASDEGKTKAGDSPPAESGGLLGLGSYGSESE
jgi:hypothetical protein